MNFGSFEDFSWPGTLPEFKKHNLFYGKNGSGKTTFSHFLQCYEEEKFPEDFAPAPSMEIITEEGKSSEFSALSGRIKVFNTYYISNNLFWDGGHATNLLWLGRSNIEIQNAVTKLDEDIDILEKGLPNLEQASKTSAGKVDVLLTDHSKIIRNFLGYDQSKYQKTHLKKDYADIIGGRLEATILSDEDYKTKRDVALATSAELEIPDFKLPQLNIKAVSKSVLDLITKKITPSIKIDELMQNPDLKRWVEAGLTHHADAGECKFCKNSTLTGQRLDELKGFFDDTQKKFVSQITIKINDLKGLLSGFDSDSIDKTRITKDYEKENLEAIRIYKENTTAIKQAIQTLVSALQRKEKDLYADINQQCAEIHKIDWDVLESNHLTSASIINEVRAKHNKYVRDFDKLKKSAQREIELHLALQQKNEYITRVGDSKKSQEEYEKATLSYKKKIAERTDLKGKISSSHQAAEFINNLIKQMGHVHVRLDYDNNKQAYLLKRGGKIAMRLSEGEKTAIAFAHFIASLQQKDFNKSESIIVIDDPISSLDATACYFIYGLVRSLEKEVNQLFLMTHSHSFFVLLMKHFRGKSYGHYEIHRFTKPDSEVGCSKIVEMETRKTKYYTEYNYLFSQIYTAANEIKSGQSIEFDRLYNLMNCSRKLIEAFLGFKYPHDLGNLDKKWQKAVEDYSIDTALQNTTFRVINFGSHSGVDGFMAGSGLESSEMVQCVSLLLDFVQSVDSKHYDGMVLCENEGVPQQAKTAA